MMARGETKMETTMRKLTLAYLAIALTLVIGAGFCVYDRRTK